MMPQKLYIGNYAKGMDEKRQAFNINNDSFPFLYNFYTYRGQVKRKRGTKTVGQLQRQVELVAAPANPWEYPQFALVGGEGNLITALSLGVTESAVATITPGSISIVVNGETFTEPDPPDGTLVGDMGGSGTINYATGAITITGGGANNVTGSFSYYPGLPVMGLRDLVVGLIDPNFPELLAFDTDYSYQFNQNVSPKFFFNTTYFKGSDVPFTWSGDDYQLFWTINYEGALWATNNVPGLNFVDGVYVSGTGTNRIVFDFTSIGGPYQDLVIGSKLFFNQWNDVGVDINLRTGTIVTLTDPTNGRYEVEFSSTVTVSGTGIALLLNNAIEGQDGIKWYDGDPTNNTGIPIGNNKGWMNFSPPLTAALTVQLNNVPPAKYYLSGAKMIGNFKDRLLFFSPWIQAPGGSPIQLIDTILWSWNGTPYFADPVPTDQTSDPTAYYVDQAGKGGYQSAGVSSPIATFQNNEDALIVGFGGDGAKTRFLSTGDDILPFVFYNINNELPSSSSFSSVTLDRGMIDFGTYGFALTDQQSSQRIDLDIPDRVFQVSTLNNGIHRVNAIRDFKNEVIYFSYPLNRSEWKFPTQTFLFNYRDNTWGILYENYTAHGYLRESQKFTWSTVPFDTWAVWNELWNAGITSALIPQVIAGNPQGYVLTTTEGTGEVSSGTIYAVADDGNGLTQITSYNHCVSDKAPEIGIGDYLYFTRSLGSTFLNGKIGQVISTFDGDTDNFVVDIPYVTSTYLGLGKFTRLSLPLMQTKQFPAFWEQGRKVRLGIQKYLMDSTSSGQVTVNIYLSQDDDTAWNNHSVSPNAKALITTQLMYTCIESTNLGLTPANINLQQVTQVLGAKQIWHRFNQSLIGDTVQVGITLSDTQMRVLQYATDEIVLHAMQFDLFPGPILV